MKRTAIIALGIVNLVLLPLAIGGACIRTAPSLPVVGPEAESLFTGLTGAWVIDREATNSSRTSLESAVVNSDGLMGVPANETSQIMREIPEIADQETLHFVSDAVLKLTQYPLTLALHVDPTQVVSLPLDLRSQGRQPPVPRGPEGTGSVDQRQWELDSETDPPRKGQGNPAP